MPNSLNLLGGIAGFFMVAALLYGFWQPASDFINYFPTGLREFIGVIWVGFCLLSGFLVFEIIVSDEKGG